METDGSGHAKQTNRCVRRRVLFATLAGSCLPHLVPAAHAQVDADARNAFIELSRILTGHRELDEEQATRLHEALRAQARDFDADTRALLGLINERKIAVDRLQRTLDSAASRLAALPRKIVSAWYTGIVGADERARCVTFETSLMYAAVNDRLAIPSYCHGPYGSWAARPG